MRIELERAGKGHDPPPPDRRPQMPEPPPVMLVAVEDVCASASAGLEKELDDFYVSMLGFRREAGPGDATVAYRAENVRLIFQVNEPPMERHDMRPIAIAVASVAAVEQQIIERKFEYQRLKALVAGQDSLLLQDPAGNWVSISEARQAP